jgi:hypothetical protein
MGLPLGDLVRVQFGGNVASEDWATGCWLVPQAATSGSQANLALFVADCVTPLATFWTAALKPQNAPGLTLTYIKAWWYFNAVLQGVAQSTVAGGAATGTAPQPGYVSRVVGLYSNDPRRSGRGRMYLPRTSGAPSGTTFQYASDPTTLSQLKTMLQAFETSLASRFNASGGAPLSVVSRVTSPPPAVTTLKYDSIPDTQHGRTRKFLPVAIDTLAY